MQDCIRILDPAIIQTLRLISKYPNSVPLLRSQLRTAGLLMEDASTDQDPATVWRKIASARSTLESVERVLGRVPMTCDEAVELRRSAAFLRDELKRLGAAELDAA
jgi:hypothetical protein